MNLIDLIRDVSCTKGDDFLCSEEFIEMLENMDSKEKLVFSDLEPFLFSLIRNGVMREMLSWSENNFMDDVDDWLLCNHRKSPLTQTYGFLRDIMEMVGIGIGKESAVHTYRMTHEEENAIKQGGEPDGDERLEYLSNGEGGGNTQGEVWLDTGVEVPKGSKLELWSENEICDGPIAGYAHRKWPWSRENRLEISINNRMLLFNCSSNWKVDQPMVFKQNTYHSIAYNLRPSEHEQGIVRGCDCDRKPTVKLFRFADKYAWTGLKIFGFKVTDGNNVVIADMIPVMHRGKPCMYDKVRKKYFYLKEKEIIINPFK